MIQFNSNFKVAKKVLAVVNKKMEQHVANDCSVEAYCNGREQGYCISQFCTQLTFPSLRIRKVSFSENRNNDDIVVYFGESHKFAMGGNIPSEKVYHNAKYFRYDKIDEAAQFIVDFFAEGE